MLDAFESLHLDFACITETWFKGGKDLTASLHDVEGATGVSFLHRSRDGRGAAVGGGVALAFNSGSCNFKRRTLCPENRKWEILAAVGKVKKITRKMVVFVVYIPPRTKVSEHAAICEALSMEISAARTAYPNPLIFIAGDFNHRGLDRCMADHPGLTAIPTGPTRGTNTLDIIYTNFGEAVADACVLVPLQTDGGVPSNHACVSAVGVFPSARDCEWEVKWVRKKTRKGKEAWIRDCLGHDWSELKAAVGVNAKVAIFEGVVQALSDKHFPMVRIRKRSNEWPWITLNVRRLWKRKLRLYKKNGRCQKWWDTDAQLQRELEQAKESFLDKMLAQGNAGKSFYAATRALSRPSGEEKWSVKDLFDDKSPANVCSRIL